MGKPAEYHGRLTCGRGQGPSTDGLLTKPRTALSALNRCKLQIHWKAQKAQKLMLMIG